jgi:23S rRNA (cytidine1920-2'-O)/16S rRNA (cytidine1409-2'-O)-methyltransferase
VARRQGLAALLVERGLFDDVKLASSWIMARKVRVADEYVTQPGKRVAADARIDVVGLDQRYVSRGGEKLEGALEGFSLSVAGLQVLDAGASTGGFTDCLLRHGAARVYAVDVGFGQLRGSIAQDPRVVALERTNIGDLSEAHFDGPPVFCTADLSYLSLEKSLPILTPLLAPAARILHLVKPLFEGVAPEEAREQDRLRTMLERVAGHAPEGVGLVGFRASSILGSNGTVEFFGLFECGSAGAGNEALDAEIDAALRQADRVIAGSGAG